MDSKQTLNPEMIDEIKAIAGEKNTKLLNTMIESYLEDLPPDLAHIKSAIVARDKHKLAESAHALKSSSVTLGAEKLAHIALQLELKGKNDDMTQLDDLFTQLEAEAEHVKLALQKELN